MFDSETRYWRDKYKNDEIPEEFLDELCGETRALLDGSAETAILIGFCIAMVIAGVVLILMR